MSFAYLASFCNEEMIALPAFRCRWSRFEPYHGMLGCDLSSSHPFEGTLAPHNLVFVWCSHHCSKETAVDGCIGKNHEKQYCVLVVAD